MMMGETWLSGFAAAPLALVGAYLFGVASGWLFWGGSRPRAGERAEAGRDEQSSPLPAGTAEAEAALDSLEAELRAARARLSQDEAETKSIGAEIDGLDSAVKRANGRLKLIHRAIQKPGEAAR